MIDCTGYIRKLKERHTDLEDAKLDPRTFAEVTEELEETVTWLIDYCNCFGDVDGKAWEAIGCIHTVIRLLKEVSNDSPNSQAPLRKI